MQFSADATPAEIDAFISRFKSICNWTKLKKRLEQIEADCRKPYTGFLIERFSFELALLDILNHKKATGRTPWPPSPAQHRVYSFIAMFTRVHHRLSDTGKIRLAGYAEGSLNQTYGFSPLVHELKIATNLLYAGFDITFTDYEQIAQYDFLVEKNGKKIEVECKSISGDVGRKIHKSKLEIFAQNLRPLLDNFRRTLSNGCFIEIEIPDRLTCQREQLQKINFLLNACLNSKTPASDGHYKISISDFDLSNSPFNSSTRKISQSDLTIFMKLQGKYADNMHAFSSYHPGKNAVVVFVKSAKEDEVLKGMFKNLREDSKKQFSGTQPGILCVSLSDVTEAQLLEIAETQKLKATGLQIMANQLLSIRKHLHSIAFMTHGHVRHKEINVPNGIITSYQEQGHVYHFHNPAHPQVNDQDLIFYRTHRN